MLCLNCPIQYSGKYNGILNPAFSAFDSIIILNVFDVLNYKFGITVTLEFSEGEVDCTHTETILENLPVD